eukprot:s9416_g2.t1
MHVHTLAGAPVRVRWATPAGAPVRRCAGARAPGYAGRCAGAPVRLRRATPACAPVRRCVCAGLRRPVRRRAGAHFEDGISKLLVKSEVLKLMGQEDQLLACEKMGKMLVEQNMASQDFHEPTAVKILGRFFIRAALYLTKKEGKGRETQIYGSLAKIHEQYMREQQKGMPSSSAAAVQVMLDGKPVKVVTPQSFRNMVALVLVEEDNLKNCFDFLSEDIPKCWGDDGLQQKRKYRRKS